MRRERVMNFINGKKLYRSRHNKTLAGVCAGIADFFNMDASLVRLITLVLIFAAGLSIWVYVIAAIIIPEEPVYKNPEDNNFNNSNFNNNNPYREDSNSSSNPYGNGNNQ